MEQIVMPIFVKTFLGERIIVAQIEGNYPDFSMPKEKADCIKTASGFSKNEKLFNSLSGKGLPDYGNKVERKELIRWS